MDTIQHIIIDDTLRHIADSQYAGYLCHAFCRAGLCTFEYRDRTLRFGKGDCLIVPRRGDLVRNLVEHDDFQVDVIYVTQAFIEISTPQTNYGMRGHLSLFENPIMHLTPRQQEVCALNFDYIKLRLAQTNHRFHRDAMKNAIECMILDFFDFHAQLYGTDHISSQNHQLMEQFIEMLEQGDFRRNREISYYADRLCVTPKYLSEVSRKVSGLPANYWITRYAALDISRCLREKTRAGRQHSEYRYTFTEIAELFGFSSPAHFSRYVQHNLGAKPSDFRE